MIEAGEREGQSLGCVLVAVLYFALLSGALWFLAKVVGWVS